MRCWTRRRGRPLSDRRPPLHLSAVLSRGLVAACAAWTMLLAPPAHPAARIDAADAPADPAIAAPAAPAAPETTSAPAPRLVAARTVRAPHTTAPVPARPLPAPEPPHDLRRISDWLTYRSARHIVSLPSEARIFYRRGLIARQSGQTEEALVDVRGAAELDPSFVDPRLTLAAWLLVREPSQALQQYAAAIELLRQSFGLQLALVVNALVLGFEALFAGLLFTGLLHVAMRRDELTHAWRESLARFTGRENAGLWMPFVLVLPYFAGFGLTLPTLAFLGYLWPALRVRERAAFVLLLAAVVATPAMLHAVERLSLPLDDSAAPYYGVATLENAPYSAERETALRTIAAANPDDGLVQFGLGWTARRGGHLAAAEDAYRRVVAAWPDDDRALTDLGNVIAIEGRTDEALQCYQRAIQRNPMNAAAQFNSAQLYTQRFDYQAATEALARASALDFELVRSYQAQASTDGLLPLIDQWLAPVAFWRALEHAPMPLEASGALPPTLRGHIETRGWRFSLAAVAIALLGLLAGTWQHKRLHLRVCNNCGRTVCRRCSQRRREQAFCPGCAAIEAGAETAAFARAALQRERQRLGQRRRLVQTALATTIPGFGLIAHRRVFTPALLLSLVWLLGRLWTGETLPFALEPRLTAPGQELPGVALAASSALVYAMSLLGYLHFSAQERRRESSLESSQRGRLVQATRRESHLAA